jgi:prepilin-type N-terminal cleavage/methylation domain-containing protein
MKSCPSNHPGRGYTLMELLIAMSLLVVLGGGLVTLLGQAVSTWNTAENRGKVYEQARAVLDRAADDLRSVVIRSHSSEGDTWIRFIADADPDGRQRLRFVRTTSGEAADAILREGGRYLSVRTPATYDGQNDAKEASAGILAAPGGLEEVMYAADPRAGMRVIWRAARSPPGGPDSLLVDRNVEAQPVSAASTARKPAPKPAAVPAAEATAAVPADEPAPPAECHLSRVAIPIAENVLFLGFSFWTPRSNTWNAVPALRDPKPGQQSGPSPWWDSTRGLLDVSGSSEEFVWKRRPDSLDDPKDDIFPEMVEVTVVIGERGDAIGTRLTDDVNETAKSLSISRAVELPDAAGERFVLVDDEWIEIDAVEGSRLTIAANGRGARWTKAAKHDRGARVEIGTTFRRVVEIPGFRSEPDAVEDRRRGRSAYRP